MSQDAISARPSWGCRPPTRGIKQQCRACAAGSARSGAISSLACIVIGLLLLGLLIWRRRQRPVGLVAIVQKVDPATLAPKPLEELSKDELVALLQAKISQERVQPARTRAAIRAAQQGRGAGSGLRACRSAAGGWHSWPLSESLFQRAAIEQQIAEQYPERGAEVALVARLGAS